MIDCFEPGASGTGSALQKRGKIVSTWAQRKFALCAASDLPSKVRSVALECHDLIHKVEVFRSDGRSGIENHVAA